MYTNHNSNKNVDKKGFHIKNIDKHHIYADWK